MRVVIFIKHYLSASILPKIYRSINDSEITIGSFHVRYLVTQTILFLKIERVTVCVFINARDYMYQS